MVGFKGSTQEKSIFEIFRFRLKKSPHDKKVPDRVGSGLMFGGGDAVFDELFEIAKVMPQSSGKQKRFDDRTNFNREFCGAKVWSVLVNPRTFFVWVLIIFYLTFAGL